MQVQSLKRTFGKFEGQFKLIHVTESIILDTATLTKSLFQPKSSPRSAQIRRLNPRRFKTISKMFTASSSPTTKPTELKDVPSKSSTVSTKRLTADSPNIAKKFNVRTLPVQCSSI